MFEKSNTKLTVDINDETIHDKNIESLAKQNCDIYLRNPTTCNFITGMNKKYKECLKNKNDAIKKALTERSIKAFFERTKADNYIGE